eukprot:CAMPEP_0194145466 /NCGR_PEP_ID=MMETSP0152-20130528/17447_1 /TAXON_ID=1049557 /ORGANISM="Thalassiothrix antarctica, Strain L6-D1" /LENGTH=135 /DNA_ID=CAMNT_0038845711 /DNA_START=61 /DNA_END=465 /DNA_ORIENTATION=-
MYKTWNLDEDNDACMMEEITNQMQCKTRVSLEGKLFKEWDANKDGLLDKADILNGVRGLCQLNNMHFDRNNIEKLFKSNIRNQKGRLNREDFEYFLKCVASNWGIENDDMTYVLNSEEDSCADLRKAVVHKENNW